MMIPTPTPACQHSCSVAPTGGSPDVLWVLVVLISILGLGVAAHLLA